MAGQTILIGINQSITIHLVLHLVRMLMCWLQETRHSLGHPTRKIGHPHCVLLSSQLFSKRARPLSGRRQRPGTRYLNGYRISNGRREYEICSDPKRTVLKSAGSPGPSGSCYLSNYGKQSGPKTCQPPKTPLAYGPGEGSRLDSNVDCFFENYTMADWNSWFRYKGEYYELPKNNLERDTWAVKYERFENLVGDRHRSASRDRRDDEHVPTQTSENILNNWWLSQEQPYRLHQVPKPLPGEEGVSYVRVDKEEWPVFGP